MASGPITSWQIDGETVETVSDFIFLGSKITADSDCSHEIKRHLLLGRKAMTNLDSILKSRDITLPARVCIVKTQWTWVSVNSWSWWWTGRPCVLQFMGSQRVRHDWATELTENKVSHCFHCFPIYLPWSDGTRCHDLSFHSWIIFIISFIVFYFSSSIWMQVSWR